MNCGLVQGLDWLSVAVLMIDSTLWRFCTVICFHSAGIASYMLSVSVQVYAASPVMMCDEMRCSHAL